MFYKDAIFKHANGKKGIHRYKCDKLLLMSQTCYRSLTSIKADYYDKRNREKQPPFRYRRYSICSSLRRSTWLLLLASAQHASHPFC